MKFVVDIGNSNVVFGLWKDSTWVHIWRVETSKNTHPRVFYFNFLRDALFENNIAGEMISTVVVSSVVPDLNKAFTKVLQRIFGREPVFLTPQLFSKLQLTIDRPSEIGSDLVANAIAAVSLYRSNCIIIDFGTALTCTSITNDYRLLGVAIAPGLQTAMKALFGSTAQLPEAPVHMPENVIGKNTAHAIQAGVICGYFGLVKELIQRTKSEADMEFKVVATGGISEIIESYHSLFDEVNQQLTLDGLRIIAESLDLQESEIN